MRRIETYYSQGAVGPLKSEITECIERTYHGIIVKLVYDWRDQKGFEIVISDWSKSVDEIIKEIEAKHNTQNTSISNIKDEQILEAVKLIQNYCEGRTCNNCVFNTIDGPCTATDKFISICPCDWSLEKVYNEN